METRAALAKFEAAVKNQLALAGDPAVERAGRALLAALEPAARQLAWDLAGQAAEEVGAQLPYNEVEVTLKGGEPALGVREVESEEQKVSRGEYEARITLRLPADLKNLIEQSARAAGESVNAYVVRQLPRVAARSGQAGKSLKGTVRS